MCWDSCSDETIAPRRHPAFFVGTRDFNRICPRPSLTIERMRMKEGRRNNDGKNPIKFSIKTPKVRRGDVLVCGSVASEKRKSVEMDTKRLSERKKRWVRLNGPGSLGSVIRLRFKSARLETRDARPVVSDNGLLFFRGQMLDQNCRQRREPSATPARGPGSLASLRWAKEEGRGQTRVSSPLHKSPAYLSACVFWPRLVSFFLRRDPQCI